MNATQLASRLRWIIRQLMDEARVTREFDVKKDLTHTAHQLAYQARLIAAHPDQQLAAEAYLEAGINVLAAAVADRAFATTKEIQ